MLQPMTQPDKNLPAPDAQSFAGLLASLTAPEKNGPKHATGWDDEELAEDVLSLSYEPAVQAKAAHENGTSGAGEQNGVRAGERSGPEAGERDQATQANLRTASVTIRLSHAECARLRRRAAEAGLTVSGYVRSCVLETDLLRAQVKEALAEMKTTAGQGSASAAARRPWLGWIGRMGRMGRNRMRG
jgi:hypothetical protein